MSAQQPLLTVSPYLYLELIDTLKKVNIHSFDIQIYALEEQDKITIIAYYGESFQQKQQVTFSSHIKKNVDQSYLDFCEKIGESCKETLLKDYFKMMN